MASPLSKWNGSGGQALTIVTTLCSLCLDLKTPDLRTLCIKLLMESVHTFTRLWYHIDCRGQVVGRLAVQVSLLLMGKTKPIYHPAVDVGDHVILTNTQHVVFTGKKWTDKLYRHHTGYPGGLKEITAEKVHAKDPTAVIKKAVNGMLPKNQLRPLRMKRLHLFPNEMDKDHAYAQNITHRIQGVTIVPRALHEYTQEEIDSFPKVVNWPLK